MDIAATVKNFLSGGSRAKNSANSGVSGSDFLRYGNRKMNLDDTSKVTMSDIEFYSGYSYAAINNRANKAAQLASESIKTHASDALQEKARKEKKEIVHPYLTLIDESDDFTNTEFWYDISTYLDLEGVYYLMAVRAVAPNIIGKIQYFKMLNPYEVRRVRDMNTMEIGGYVETRDGQMREIPKEMIIEIKKLHPFSRDHNFAMTDAAKDSQFTLKQAADYTRSSLKNNLSAPGILSTDVLLDTEQFQNFVARVSSQEKGQPIFANGSGAISWESMQIDLDKSALMDVTKINRDQLFAVAGVSASTLGVDEAGTTRDVSKTQKEKFIEDHIMPQLQLVLDALNQDYKKYYKKEYQQNRYRLYLDNPLGSDKDAELKDIEIAKESFDLFKSLLSAGYDVERASKFVAGEITLEELGEPTNKPEEVVDKKKKPKDGEEAVDEPEVEEDQEEAEEDAKKKAADKKKKLNYLKRYGIEKFVQKYDGQLSLEELNEYVEVE